MVQRLSFSNEDEMYPIIADFLHHYHQFRGCKAVENKITFNLLKGWKIDVAGIIEDRNNYLIAVEAKNEISASSVLQAISQAEMYQKICNEVYIALPRDEITRFKDTNRIDWERITDLCRVKGIGIMSVGDQECDVIEKAMRLPRFSDLYEDIVNQINLETLESFQGFTERDFDYFIERAEGRRDVVKKKIQLLIQAIKHQILSNPRDFHAIDTKKLVAELPKRGFGRHGCWFFVAEAEKRRLPYIPHFTFHVNSEEGVSCLLTLETIRTTDKFIQKLQTEEDKFLGILERLHDKDEDYELKIWEQIPEPGKPRRSQWDWHEICSFKVGYIDQSVIHLLLKKLSNTKYPIVRLVCPPVLRGDRRLYSEEIVTVCTKWIKDLQGLYAFLFW